MYFSTCSNLSGIESHVHNLLWLLGVESEDVRFIGIWGMGGIGKTTVAEVLLSRIFYQFDACCFLSNIREESKRHGLVHLRKRLFFELLQNENLSMDMFHVLPTSVLYMLEQKKVFIVLDDVNDSNQLKALLGNCDWFCPGSRVIMTSRDKEVLNNGVDQVYEVKSLKHCDALQLLSMEAFKQKHPPKGFVELSERVVDYAKRVPLALKTLGSHLCKRSPKEWEIVLDKLKQFPDRDIIKILRISYDELDQMEKDIFLDIACFYRGYSKDYVESILDGCGFFTSWGIIRLTDKCLITVLDNKIEMHDLIQEMGQEIARQNGSRLWNSKEIRCMFITDDEGARVVEGIFLDMSEMGNVQLRCAVLSRMFNLRLLQIYRPSTWSEGRNIGPIFESDQTNQLKFISNKVSLFHWDNYPYKSLPSNFFMENLVELKIKDSKVEQLWNGNQCLEQLKVLNLHGCKKLRSLPSLAQIKSLEFLNLCYCSNLKMLPETPTEIEELYLNHSGLEKWSPAARFFNNLKNLQVWECKNLRTLPTTISLNSADQLSFWGCSSLKECPEIIGDKISILDLSRTAIKELKFLESPAALYGLSSLRRLILNNCTRLQALPELPSLLQTLEAKNCPLLETVASASSTIQKEYERAYKFNFYKSINLDQNACGNIMGDALQRSKEIASSRTKNYSCEVILPGSEIPEWFNFQSPGSSVTIKVLPSSFNSTIFLNFAFCIVIEVECLFPSIYVYRSFSVSCEFRFKTANGVRKVEISKEFYFESDLSSNHVYLWCDDKSRKPIDWFKHNHSSVNEASLEFKVRPLSLKFKENAKLKVKRSGVHLVSAENEQNERNISRIQATNLDVVDQVVESTDITGQSDSMSDYEEEEQSVSLSDYEEDKQSDSLSYSDLIFDFEEEEPPPKR
ncbi:hypothetical protein JCGZ_10938 [Jatropha curcas]|uniref:ADP-ribosyl cyclase/cyclic ADP-ribose hydrolase n=1 Tax=Jatropha curcas TaxID=180498 RepID=A0A067KFT7_JATCU|nr:hypothetical protein JCGZ_10938 [Jatropha curcas]